MDPVKAIVDNSVNVELDLFGRGMGLFHRAGLAGLVSTLQWIEKNVPVAERPQGTWRVDDHRLAIEAPNAEAFLQRLYAVAFQTCDGIYFMPGKHPFRTPALEVLAPMHRAVTATFYSHKPSTCGKRKALRVLSLQIDNQVVTCTYDEWSKFGHAGMYTDLLDGGGLTRKPVVYKGGVAPGAMERHAGLAGTEAVDSAEHVLCLHFALVACITLPGRTVNDGVIVVPEVNNLQMAQRILQSLIPTRARDCYVGGASDAAFQAELRLRLDLQADIGQVPACVGMTTAKKPWNAFSRDSVVHANPGTPELETYQTMLASMPTRCMARKQPAKDGTTHFWLPSVCRALFADNLARGHRWYEGFNRRFVSNDLTEETLYERKELQNMVENIQWSDGAERTLVQSVHEALRRRFGAIASENEGNTVARNNRMNRERDRLRLALAHAKTTADFRHTITDLWSRAGTIQELQEHWAEILPFLGDSRWEHGRDLALLALASYRGKTAAENLNPNDSTTIKEQVP